jgi:GAF domain-containing protein
MNAPLPPNEAARMTALRSYQILDSAAEEVFDGITRLASYICQTPISLISLVDEKRQWFKSRVGTNQQETPRDVAFCAHTILRPEPMIVPDAMEDTRFHSSPLVTSDPNIRFYAGFPLINPEGHALGALCAIDRKRRELTPEQEEAMAALGRQVIAVMELRRVSLRLAYELDHVKRLRGLLPICAWCKRIRDDQGYWNQVESYLRSHTEVDFTHGICPDCLERERAKRTVAA